MSIPSTLLNWIISVTAVNNGYIDVRTFGDDANIEYSADLLISSGEDYDAQGDGYLRLTAADGSIFNLNDSDILAANSHLVLKARDDIGLDGDTILTDVEY